jgi:uncharacterized protein with NRDE domain
VCTLVALHRTHPEHALVVAANRDEFYARKTAPPSVIVPETGAVAGRDLEAGGTWLGATRAGFFVGLTNQRTLEWPIAKAPRSRGAIPLEALRRGSVAGTRTLISEISHAEYKPFNLMYGDGLELEVAYIRPEGFEIVPLEPGIHVLCNDRMGSPDFPKADRARSLVRSDSSLEELARMLADRELPDPSLVPEPPPSIPKDFVRELQAICIRTPAYGTRSSTIVAAGEGAVDRYSFTDGPPDVTSPTDLTHLFGAQS